MTISNHRITDCRGAAALGKVWKPKEEEKVQINEDDKVETEWDEVLAQATEEELVDLAGLLRFFFSAVNMKKKKQLDVCQLQTVS
jgi:hypothetical protein